MAPFPESAVVTLPVPAKQLLDLQESTAFRTLLAQARSQRHLPVQCAVQNAKFSWGVGRKSQRCQRRAAGLLLLRLRSSTEVTSWC